MSLFSLSGAFCLHNRVCIIEQTDDSLLIGMVHAEDADLMDKLTAAFSAETQGRGVVHFMPVTEEECLRHITGTIADGAEIGEDTAGYAADKAADASDVNACGVIVNLLDNIVLEAIARNASDIHLEPYSQPLSDIPMLCIRFRTAGTLQLFKMYDGSVLEQLVRRIKVLAGLNAEESRQCQDGRFIWQSAGDSAPELRTDIRVSCIPVWNGESVVLRLLRTLSEVPEITELGFSAVHQEALGRILRMKNRLVIVSGPTGAGKTTTLAALLSQLAREGKKIITVEDPVEYRIPGVTQIEIHEESRMGFQDVLKRVFRHDPDILMIGEIRDVLTARIAVRAALTGHLVFATLHASNACAAAIRLFELGIPPYLVSSVFGAVIAQELIPWSEPREGPFAGRMLAAEILEGVPRVTSELCVQCTEADLACIMSAEDMPRLEDDIEIKRLLSSGQEKKTRRKEVKNGR